MLCVVTLVFLLEVLSVVNGQSGRRCSTSRLSDCKRAIEDSIGKRVVEMSGSDTVQHCNIVREDFSCMINEMRCLNSASERQRNADLLRKAFVYLRDGCDTRGDSWKDSPCYIDDSMKSCENSYPVSSMQYTSYNADTCRTFNQFRDCVQHVIKNRCPLEDKKHLGQYLVVKAQDLAWNCPEDDADRDRSRERDYGRSDDRSDRFRDRGRDRDQSSRSQSDYGSERYNDRYDRDRYDSRHDSGNTEITCCRNERCDSSRMQQCRSSLTRTVDDRNGNYADSQKCKRVRDDFNCLLWQTTCVPREERDRASDLFHRARDYISRKCDTYGRWSENSCYKSSEMQRCETMLSTTRGGANYESCRAYNQFRDCMEEELRRRCTREDELLQGAYLVEKAQEMAWQCGSENIGSGYRDRDRDTFRTNDRSGYDSDRSSYDRGSYDRGGYDRDRYDRDRYDRDRYDRYDRNDQRYPSAIGSFEESPHLDDDDAMCLSRMQTPAENCRNDLNERKRRLITESNYDLKQRGECCAAIRYKRCLLDGSRRTCLRERGRVVESLLGRERYLMNADKCRGLSERDCSAASAIHLSAILLAFTSVLLALL